MRPVRAPGLILLAAGGSTRMGRPKQLLPWGDRSLLRHACHTALATLCRPVIVVLGCEADACRVECADLRVITVVNENWARGLGSSIAVGLAKLETESPEISGVVLMLVDQPSVTPEWLGQFVERAPSSALVATRYGESGGTPAYFAREFFPELQRLPPHEGARTLLAREHQNVQLMEGPHIFFDLDTPEAYREHAPTI
ncbi:MAG: 4-diphosphocytidyl-2C-methyl-D-erythritolsynthas e [Verrucomicrobia bacterium]|nr:4-diphosphocytidyl-2C-methyl-D-erythritolsynthas e [Verrucomicrobiota bacterium]